ncbi:MAG: hypothetical protein ACLFVE_15170 [Chitinispirillaceae bacterium]
MIKKTVLIISCFCFSVSAALFGLPGSDRVGGYVSELPLVTFGWDTTELDYSNLVHARMNYNWYPMPSFALEVAGRFQLFTGSLADLLVSGNPLIDQIGEDRGYADLTDAWPSLLYLNVDRAWISYSRNDFVVAAGRQRVNWGTNLVWNPNDWFNAFEYLDFDYEERPGTDALRFTYYLGSLSALEVALKAGRSLDRRTYAAMYRLNYLTYDLQFQGGLFGRDAAAGFSWVGSILGGGFRGEVATYLPVLESDGSFSEPDSATIIAALSGDYTFENGFYIHSEALYNGFGGEGRLNPLFLSNQDFSAKNLTPAKYLVYGSFAYPFTPLTRGSVSAIVNPEDYSFYISPSLTWSLSNNIEALFIAQLFYGEEGDVYGSTPNLAGVRVRWSF